MFVDSDFQWEVEQFGRKSINEVRADAGRPPVKGGEIAYVDWLKRMAGLPLRPDLTLVPQLGPLEDSAPTMPTPTGLGEYDGW